MEVTTLSSREFNQEVGRAKKAAKQGPVIVTDRGKPTHVLLDYDAYRRLTGGGPSILDLLGDAEAAEIALEIPPRLRYEPQPVDFD